MARRFGTDGVRGVANAELTPELVVALGRATARVFGAPSYLIGRDTRRSGPMLTAALTAGVTSEGADVIDLGVLPTPAVAYCASLEDCPALVVSASHNPFADNGIKVFATGGRKLEPSVEEAIEVELERLELELPGTPGWSPRPHGAGVGVLAPAGDLVAAYAEHVLAALEGRRLENLSVILDCAHGAACVTAAAIFGRLGARTEVIHAEPDGMNINDASGSTHPEVLAAAVVDRGADLGLAFDGDADRCLAVDNLGELVDGDQMLALFALDRMTRGRLPGGKIVVTVMTNLGFHLAMGGAGIDVVETPVGDRNVLDAMVNEGLVLGGEQSGHLIFADLATTGDGVLTGALLADLVCRRGEPLSALATTAMQRLPQRLASVAVTESSRLAAAGAVWTEVRLVEEELGGRGRVVLRASGTEPVVRVMVEAQTFDLADRLVERLCGVVRTELT